MFEARLCCNAARTVPLRPEVRLSPGGNLADCQSVRKITVNGALPPCPIATFDRICREVVVEPREGHTDRLGHSQGSLAEPGEAEGSAIAPAREPD
jgi:hypothetical protein